MLDIAEVGARGIQYPIDTYLCPQSTILALPAPPPVPLATSLCTVRLVNQSANRTTASVYRSWSQHVTWPAGGASHQVSLGLEGNEARVIGCLLDTAHLVRWEDDAFHDCILDSLGEDMLQSLGKLDKCAVRSLEPNSR